MANSALKAIVAVAAPKFRLVIEGGLAYLYKEGGVFPLAVSNDMAIIHEAMVAAAV